MTAIIFASFEAMARDAQAANRGNGYAFDYHHAVTCAGFFNSLQRPASDTQAQKAQWRYTLAAGELARRENVRPRVVDKAIAKATHRFKGLNARQVDRQRALCVRKLADEQS